MVKVIFEEQQNSAAGDEHQRATVHVIGISKAAIVLRLAIGRESNGEYAANEYQRSAPGNTGSFGM